MRNSATRSFPKIGLTAGRRRKLLHYLEGYLYATPTLLGLLVFSGGAIVASFVVSFTNWEIVLPPRLVWFRNYIWLLHDPLFWKVLRNTAYYSALYVPSSVVLSLFMAVLVNQKLRGMSFFRALYFLPTVSSMTAVAMIWKWIYHPSFGLLNYFLGQIGIQGPNWLGDVRWAMPSLSVVGVWIDVGYLMIIYLAGLQGIPEELYEAARIDGADALGLLRHITIPLLSPTIFFVLIIAIIGSFQIFTTTYMMTQGGPRNSTLTVCYLIFQNAFQWFHMGLATATSYVLFAIVLAITLIQFRFQARWVFYK